jgi:hypothetical protein
MKKMKRGLVLVAMVLLNLILAFKILSLKSNWAVAGFILYIILLVFITQKTIKKL